MPVNWQKIVYMKDVMYKIHTLQNQFTENLQFCFASTYPSTLPLHVRFDFYQLPQS